ncbi:MAG TPA: YitT family protein [Bacilli bacterium]|nr:YitT family protein [Bacilli bacterium]
MHPLDKAKKWRKRLIEISFITLGVAIAAFAFSFFLNVNTIVIGGGSGIGVILADLFGFDPSLVILILNVFLLILGLFLLGKEFFIKTIYGSLAYPVFVKIFDCLYQWLQVDFSAQALDMVLIIFFSSIIMGFGLGLVMKFGGTTGGTEVGQKILMKYFHIPLSTSLYFLDGIVILGGLLFKVIDIELALYAVVFTYLCGVVIDSVVFTGINKRAVYIISNKNEEIKKDLLEKFERGVTSIRVVGEYSKQDREMLICVLSISEYYRLREIIEDYDPQAFYYSVRASEVRGEGFSYDK